MKITTIIKKLIILGLLINNISPLRLKAEFSSNNKNNIKESENESEEFANNLNVNGKIYLKGTSEKHKKSHLSLSSNSSLKKKEESRSKSSSKTYSKANSRVNPEDHYSSTNTKSHDSPILAELWIKYFKYTNQELNVKTPKTFFVNSAYYQQTRLFPNIDYTKGRDYIKDKNFFYLSVFKNSLVITTSRKIQMQRNVDGFSIEEIGQTYENESAPKGGIEDFGNFDEGYCLKFNIMDSNRSIYIICFESLSEKTKIKKLTRTLKIEEQHKNGIYLIDGKTNGYENKESISSLFGRRTEREKNVSEKVTDGYWIVLQNWSQCNLKCGGGISTLHRMCIPPKKGGKPCEGKNILTKECNKQPCPEITHTSESESKKNTQVMKPIVKVMPFTNVPQRFTLCKIKESDMMVHFETDDPVLLNSNLLNQKNIEPGVKDINIPSRVIMNNSTLSIFTGEHYENLFETYILKKSGFYINKKYKGCFIIKENKKSITLCPFGCERDNKEQLEWEKHFDIFKNKCGRSSAYDINGDKELQKEIQEKMNEARQKVIDENVKKNQIKKANDDEKELKIIEKQTTTTAMKAIQKELNIEDLIKQEEVERERKEEMKIRQQIELEMKKKQCIIKAIKEKKLENEKISKAKEKQQKINDIKESAKNEVMKRRKILKEFIEKTRKKSQLKRNQLTQKLFEVRSSIASEIGKAYKKGDTNKCIVANDSTKGRNNYCIASFSNDFSFLNYCQNSDEFCEICCNNEFGDMHEEEKEKCIKEVCPLKKTGDEEEEKKREEKEKEGRCINDDGKFISQKKIEANPAPVVPF